MKHIVSFSGGIGSYLAAKRVVEQHGEENTLLVFTDTLTEDWDLYRFMIETIKDIYGPCEKSDSLLEKAKGLEYLKTDSQEWKTELSELSLLVQENYKNIVWLSDGRNVWDVFFDKGYMGAKQFAYCTQILKQQMFRTWLEKNHNPNECVVYLGIDWSEEHRYIKAAAHYKPYIAKAPMCDEPYLDKQDGFDYAESRGIEIPRLYKLGFSHNNCGGFCVKAGHGHFKNLLEKMPERFDYHEKKEQEFREHFQKDVAILRNRKGGTTKPLTLKEFRERVQQQESKQLELDDFGGCGCYPY